VSTEKSDLTKSKFSQLLHSTKSIDDSLEEDGKEENGFEDLDFIQFTHSDSEPEEEVKIGETIQNNESCFGTDNSMVHQRKNTTVDKCEVNLLASNELNQRTSSIPRNPCESPKEPKFKGGWSHCLSKSTLDHINTETFAKLRRECNFQIKAEVCLDKEDDRKQYNGIVKFMGKFKFASGNQVERAKIAVVETKEPFVGNEDLILCKKGSLISKSWIVKNVGCS